MDLTTLSLDKLKIMAYDLLATLEGAQNNLRVINAEIQKRQTENKGEQNG